MDNTPRDFDSLLTMAYTYQLIPNPPAVGSYSYKFDVISQKIEYESGLVEWLRQNRGLEHQNPDLYDKLCTWENFLAYLKFNNEEKQHVEQLRQQQFEEQKKTYQAMVFNTQTNNQQTITLPDNVLHQLQEQGFIENTAARPLKWLKSKSLLAYFVEIANDKLNLKHGNKRQIKPFEILFDKTDLLSAMNEYKNKTGKNPVGYEIIDELRF